MNFELTELGHKMFPTGELRVRRLYWGLFIDMHDRDLNLSIATNACEIKALLDMGLIKPKETDAGDALFRRLNKDLKNE